MKIMPMKGLSYDDICLIPRHSIDGRNGDLAVGDYSSPITMSPMLHTCTKDMIDWFTDNNMLATIHRYFQSPEDQFKFYLSTKIGDDKKTPFFAVGNVGRWQGWIDYLLSNGVLNFCIDMAHGDSVQCVDTIKYIKRVEPAAQVMAGNVAMQDGFVELEVAGADYIRVGIASGSCCSTYLNTGVGVPIVTSIIECHKVRRKAKIIADGGIKHPGDIAKAIAVGADFVMIGGLLSGTSMASGPFYDENKELVDPATCDPTWAEYAGMASKEARSVVGGKQMVNTSVEGIAGLVQYKGRTDEFIGGVHHNLRGSLGYLGASNWNEFNQRAKVMIISSASRVEKDTHLV